MGSLYYINTQVGEDLGWGIGGRYTLRLAVDPLKYALHLEGGYR